LVRKSRKFQDFYAKRHFWFLSKLTVFGEKWIFFEKSLTRKGWKSWNFHAKRHFWFMSKQEYMEKTAFSLKRVWSEKAHNFEISMQNVISDSWANKQYLETT
jgi:hypothetical protein